MIIYKINQNNGYFDGTMEIPDDPDNVYGIPYGTTKKAPPELTENQYVVWNGSSWDITTNPPPALKPIIYAIKVHSFYDRFGNAKYDILLSDDPEIQAYVQETRNSAYIDLEYPGLAEGVYGLLLKGFVFDPEVVLSKIIKPEEAYPL